MVSRLLDSIRFLRFTPRKTDNPKWQLVAVSSRSGKKYIIKAKNAKDLLIPINENIEETDQTFLIRDSQISLFSIEGHFVSSPIDNLRKFESLIKRIMGSDKFKTSQNVSEDLRMELLYKLQRCSHLR